MQEILSEGVPIDFCTGCRGSFLEKGEEVPFAGQPAALRRALDAGLQDPRPGSFTCPRCGGAMHEGWLLSRDFVLDRCDACEGLWFDSKELSRLKRLEAGGSAMAPPRPPAGDGATAHAATTAGTTPAPAATGVRRRCPHCGNPPRENDRWQCRCGNQWHAVRTGGTCPSCRRRWEEIQCLRCASWSPPARWSA